MTTQTLTLADFLLARYAEAAEHIRFFGNPARHCASLADVEAKRQIVEWAPIELGVGHAYGIFRLLALPYADHPDYRDEWRP